MARDTNFYYSFLVLPADKRRAIVAVWDFCRAVDDAVDEAAGEGEAREGSARRALENWRHELASAFGAGPPMTRQGRALVPLVERFHLPRAPFEALIDGVEMDLAARRYETFADLYEYCIRVASAVGLICIEIFGYQDPRAREYATELGVALQLTNILRDVPGDLAQGRLYIPQEDLRQYGCTEEDLRQEIEGRGSGVQSPAVKALLRRQAQRAREYYDRAARVLPQRDARRLLAAEIMGAIYRDILQAIERREYDVFTEVVRISRSRRAAIAAVTWARGMLRL